MHHADFTTDSHRATEEPTTRTHLNNENTPCGPEVTFVHPSDVMNEWVRWPQSTNSRKFTGTTVRFGIQTPGVCPRKSVLVDRFRFDRCGDNGIQTEHTKAITRPHVSPDRRRQRLAISTIDTGGLRPDYPQPLACCSIRKPVIEADEFLQSRLDACHLQCGSQLKCIRSPKWVQAQQSLRSSAHPDMRQHLVPDIGQSPQSSLRRHHLERCQQPGAFESGKR